MCQGQESINNKTLPLDSRAPHPMFLKMRASLFRCMTGRSICLFTRRAALSRQGGNNIQDRVHAENTCSGQTSLQSLTAAADPELGSDCPTLSCASQPWLLLCALPTPEPHWEGIWLPSCTNTPPPQTSVCSELALCRERLSQSAVSHSRQQTQQCDSSVTPATWCLASEMEPSWGARLCFLPPALPWNNSSGLAARGRKS